MGVDHLNPGGAGFDLHPQGAARLSAQCGEPGEGTGAHDSHRQPTQHRVAVPFLADRERGVEVQENLETLGDAWA